MNFTKPSLHGDIIFIVEGRKIYANKSTLSLWSEVFSAMFNSDFAEKKKPEIELPGKKYDDFLHFMEVLHPPVLRPVDRGNAYELFPLAHEYQVGSVIKRCTDILLCLQSSVRSLVLANRYSLDKLGQQCMADLSEYPFETLKQDEYFIDLDEELRIWMQLNWQPPSVENFILAKEHQERFPEAYEKCLIYLKETPFSKLKPDFDLIDKETQLVVLTHHVKNMQLTIDVYEQKRSVIREICLSKESLCSYQIDEYTGIRHDGSLRVSLRAFRQTNPPFNHQTNQEYPYDPQSEFPRQYTGVQKKSNTPTPANHLLGSSNRCPACIAHKGLVKRIMQAVPLE